MNKKTKTSRISPEKVIEKEYSFSEFNNNKTFPEKINGHLPAMGWNSWNAFGSGNTEELTKIMADKFLELGLDKLGYEYLVLDDGCYKSERVDGRLSNEEVKFPSGFRALADYIHAKGLKFGMYNDIGTNLCAGAAVGTCGFEDVDAKSYADWDIDFLKVDNCYYLWDNATFSDATNAKFTYAPNIKAIKISGNGLDKQLKASEGTLTGKGLELSTEGFVTNIGTFDGTGTGPTPVGDMSGELVFEIEAPVSGKYDITVTYATGKEPGVGQWLTLAVGYGNNEVRFFDDLMKETSSTTDFIDSEAFCVELQTGINSIRIMNHRRQENTLQSYAAMFYGLKAATNKDVILSICEWGKTQPQNWGYKVGNSWRILNDISFDVGRDGYAGSCKWQDSYTCSITSQYNKAVIMDEFAGLNKGWNDPDMMVIGMNNVNETMMRTHMAMWCMMNSPLMLGMDLRNVSKGDTVYNIIANKDLIDLNQDALGIQAKRIYSSLDTVSPDKTYITNLDRLDVLCKPLADGSFALSFINVSEENEMSGVSIDIETILKFMSNKLVDADAIKNAANFVVTDLWTKKETNASTEFTCPTLAPMDSYTIKVKAL